MSLSKESAVAKDNYSYQKYQKELAKKKKAEEKKKRKLQRKEAGAAIEPSGDTSLM
jgi:hypothetical protein